MGRKVVCRIQKLSSRKQIKGHLRHGMRDDQPDNANPDRAHLNRKVGGTAEEVIARLDARLEQVDQRDAQAVELVEMVITAAADAFGKGKVKAQSFLSDALKFARERFGSENVIAAAAHYDEIAPHVHIYIVPAHHVEAHTRRRSVFAGKDPVTGKQKRETREFEVPAKMVLSASHFFGSPKKLSQLQTDVWEAVGKPHGLDRGLKRSRATHTALKEFYGAILNRSRQCRNRLKSAFLDASTPSLYSMSTKRLCRSGQGRLLPRRKSTTLPSGTPTGVNTGNRRPPSRRPN